MRGPENEAGAQRCTGAPGPNGGRGGVDIEEEAYKEEMFKNGAIFRHGTVGFSAVSLGKARMHNSDH